MVEGIVTSCDLRSEIFLLVRGRTSVGCGRVVRGISFVSGSIPNGAGTMVLRCFLFST